ncbi:hypothetical protein C0J52_07743 [Blattella germanica]|nr:hypothetical protein C0J52_07743 [Blattella germanica]
MSEWRRELKVESWIQNGYLSRPKVINWLQGVVDRALTKVIWPPHMSVELENHVRVRRKMSGPAVTLLVSWGVPKAPRRAANDDYQWRMSFYMIEKGLMRDLNNMKPVIKLFKMLIRLEICLKQKTIQFFWDEKSNLIEPLGEHFIRNIEGRVTSLRRLLERALNGTAVNYNSLSEVVEFIFTT